MEDGMSVEKRRAMFRYRAIQKITSLIRYTEALVLIAAAVWSSARLPSAAKASGEFLRDSIIPVLLGPRFLFLVGNAIVLTLLFKSRGHLTTATNSSASGGNEDDNTDIIGDQMSSFVAPLIPPASARAEEVVFEDKNVCVETETKTKKKDVSPASPPQSPRVQRTCRRTRSEKVASEGNKQPELRRSETDIGKMKKKKKGGEEDAEEFRRVIEAFIEKQLKFQREESMMMTVCTSSSSSTSSDHHHHHHHHQMHHHHRALTCSAPSGE